MANDLSRQRNQTGTPCECNEPSAAVSQNHASDERLISRQLCELCGVEPKKIKKCKVGQGCADFPGCEGRFGDKTCYIEQTVDFTKPENFVRLWEILTKCNKDELITTAINLVTFEPGKYYCSKLAQSIRESEWVYG